MPGIKRRIGNLLREIEPYLRTDMVYLTRSGSWASIQFGISTLCSVLTFIAFGNLISKESYGLYSYLISLSGSLGFLTLTGANTSVIRAFAQGHENTLPYAIKLQLKYSIAPILCVLGASLYYAWFGNFNFAIALGLLGFAMPLSSIFHTYEFALIGKKDFRRQALLNSFSNIISTVLIIITLFLTQSVLILIIMFCLGSLLPNILAYINVSKDLPQSKPSLEILREMRHTSLHLTGAGLIATIAQYLDKIVLFQFSGPAAVAIYGFSVAGPERLKGLVKNWAIIAMPKLTTRTIPEIRSAFYHRVILSMLSGGILTFFYILISPLLFKLLLPKYMDSIIYSQTYSLALIFFPISIYIGQIFSGQNMLRAIYLVSTLSNATRILLYIIFGWLWNIWGLIIASLLYYIFNAIYNIIVWELESRRLIKNNE